VSGETRTLYRPVGLSEAQLILEAGSKAFPPRRTEQPIFYPVLNFQYAEQIARDWNTRSPESGFAGFVTQFRIDEQFGEGYKGTKHRILDIYAEEMFAMLYVTSWLSTQDFRGEILANRHAVLLNFKYWATHDLSQLALNEEQVSFLRDHADRNRTTGRLTNLVSLYCPRENRYAFCEV
jgi:hypothetical protein